MNVFEKTLRELFGNSGILKDTKYTGMTCIARLDRDLLVKLSFTDPGTGAYTRQYFNPKERYNNLEPSARAHSLPIIDGIYQIKKEGKSTIYKESEREYSFSMENGYDIENLKSLTRHFVCEDECLVLTDSFVLDTEPKSLVERFVTLVEPKIEEGRVTVGESVLVYDTEIFELTLNTDICRRKRDLEETLYMIDLSVKNPQKETTVSVKFY